MNRKNTKVSIGSTTTGVKLGFLLGVVVSTLSNVSSIGVLLESVVQWTGAFQQVIELYKEVVIEPFRKFLEDLLNIIGLDVSPPRSLAAYYSLTAGLSLTYVFLSKLKGGDVDTSDYYAAVALFSPLALIRSQIAKTKKFSWQFIMITILAIPVVVGLVFPFIVTILTIFPVFLLYQSAISLIMYFRFDFSRKPTTPDEAEFRERAVEMYDRTIRFWFVVVCTFVLSGVVVIFNNEINKKCVEDYARFHLLCGDSQISSP